MSITNGPRRGLMIDALTGDGFDADFRKFLRAIDALLFCSVVNLSTSAPPGSPANGDAYVVKPSGSGAWAGHDNAIAVWTTDNPATPGGLWEFYPAGDGMIVYSVTDVALACWTGSAWAAVGGGGGGGGSSTLAGDTDVTITSPITGQLLKWNGTKWVNSTPSGGGTLNGDSDVDITSPANNDVLTYETSSALWKNKPAAGGGGGGIAAGTNLWIALPRGTATDNNSGYTVFGGLPGGSILAFAASWKFSVVFSGSVTITGAVVYRTLPNDLTIIDATPVTFGGAALPYTNGSGGEIFSDPIALPLDDAHDYYIALTGSATTYVTGYNALYSPTAQWQGRCGYISGNQTGLTTGGTIPSLGAESDIYRIVAA